MSSQEICRDSITPAEDKTAGFNLGKSSQYDFSFAFCNLQFSDCTLRVMCDDEAANTPSESEDIEAQAEEIPVSTIVLVAKSSFFGRMFTGSFRESGGNNIVDIRMSSEDKPFFMDLLKFIYTGSLPPEAATSFQNALKLLIIADRFDTPHCVSDCSSVLDSFVSKLDTSDALMLLSLPESLQQLPNLSAILSAARSKLVKEFGNILSNPSDSSFLQLPESGVAVLLEADTLKLSSEDVIARAAMAWICHNYNDPTDRLDCLFRLVLPNIRFQCLSPKQVLQVCSFLKDPTGWAVSHFQSSDTCQTAPGPGVAPTAPQPSSPLAPMQFTEISPSDSFETLQARLSVWSLAEGGSVVQESKSLTACSPTSGDRTEVAAERIELLTTALIAVSEHALMHGGTIPRGATLESCLTGRLKAPPRVSCRPPCSIYLDIPEKLCREWQTSNEHLATSAPTCASGRWFSLQAKIYPSESTLHVQLSCDKRFPGGEFSSFQIELQLCLQTAESRPAYLQQTRKALCKYTSASASFGCRDFLGKPLAKALEQSSLYFPEGALRLRADVWLVGEAEM